ncbi:hypothetical protein [Mycobacterium conspicuum]|uniref:Low molecular weight antigen MTB12 n=1 Tax=Mycobacterium conspicuum TaxID=44010 RepID=A0A1X1SYB7_9MYCO|nr:hypothetical protein [Mycobacterium conspicuum]ORV36228.1 hypothetical protein AWC00_00790 [Mycobacterium conspicuum]BBZ40477.1 low molecular weight antigen MTB12 [Mycobacterium conspicuum]
MQTTMKSIATSAAAVAAIGVAAAFATSSVTSIASGAAPTVRVQPVAVGAPLPQDPVPSPAPAVNVPTAGQLTGLLNNLADPSVPFANKGNLVEGGISGTEAHLADHEFKKAAKNGDLPLMFNVSNIQPGAAPGSATADVAVSGPKIPSPVTQNVTFVNQGGWVLSRASAMELLQAAGH